MGLRNWFVKYALSFCLIATRRLRNFQLDLVNRSSDSAALDDDPINHAYSFSGWGMVTSHANPWACDSPLAPDETARLFRDTDNDLRRRISSGRFEWPQFRINKESGAVQISQAVGNLRWRNYVVFASARLAAKNSMLHLGNNRPVILVEAGVCDGIAAFFARAGAQSVAPELDFYLIDSWGPMRSSDFAVGDRDKTGAYNFLDVEQTMANLLDWGPTYRFVKGYVPEILADAQLPQSPMWLHIDLNASSTTVEVLEKFIPNMTQGSMCLFDDYGHKNYRQTKIAVDRYFSARRDGVLFALPTGQAIWISSG